MRSSSRTRLALLGVAAALGGLLAVPATADPVPAGSTYTDGWFRAADGTQLHAGVFLPADHRPGERHPVLLTSTPYTAPNGGATGGPALTDVPVRFPELFEHPAFAAGRYAYVQVDVRGFGGSGGCWTYYEPVEAADVRTAVEWAADQDWSSGRVGMWGKSYDAAEEVLALGSDPRGLAATVIQSPGLSGYTALWMNGVHYATGRYATTSTYTADDVAPPQNLTTATSPQHAEAALAPVTSVPANPTCRTDQVGRMNVEADRDSVFWAGREPYRQARGSDVPVFLSQGFFDANTKNVGSDVWSSLTGDTQYWFGQYTHVRGHEAAVGRRGFLDEAFRFLDRHVRGVDVPDADPEVTVQSGGPDGTWRAEEQWPPADARPRTLPLHPGGYDDAADAVTGGPASAGAWTSTPPLADALHLAGEVRFAADVTTLVPGAHLVARLYDVDADGLARLVTRGAALLDTAGAGRASFALYPQDWRLEPGHRLALNLSGGDDDWFSPGVTGTPVEVVGGTLEVPALTLDRTGVRELEGGPSDASGSETVRVPLATLEAAETALG